MANRFSSRELPWIPKESTQQKSMSTSPPRSNASNFPNKINLNRKSSAQKELLEDKSIYYRNAAFGMHHLEISESTFSHFQNPSPANACWFPVLPRELKREFASGQCHATRSLKRIAKQSSEVKSLLDQKLG